MFVGLHCGCVPPLRKYVCVRSLGYIVGASPLCVSIQLLTLWVHPPRVCPFFIGSLHAAYSALRHFFVVMKELLYILSHPYENSSLDCVDDI